jgi:AcrR family transcriptional regulator
MEKTQEETGLTDSSQTVEKQPRKPRGRPKVNDDEVLRQQIVKEAFKLFLERHYAGTTMTLLASRCGISKRTLYELFPSKVDLFAEMTRTHRANMLALPGNYDHLSLEEAFRAIFRVDQDDADYQEQFCLLRLFYFEASSHPELKAVLREHGGLEIHKLLSNWLNDQKSKGRIQSADVSATARMIMDMLCAIRLVLPPDEDGSPGVTDRKSYLEGCIQLMLNGLIPRNS